MTVSTHRSLSRNHSHPIFKVIVIIAPPQKVAYPFILDLSGYPTQIIFLFVVLVSLILFLPPDTPSIDLKQGFFYLRWEKPHAPRPFRGTYLRLLSALTYS
jgi:L-type amino acid transporter 9